MFSSNLYAKKAKGGVSKGTFGSKPAATQQQKAATPAQPAQPAANANPAAAGAANASAQNPSLLQSAMPALVGGAVGSYIGSKLAGDGETEKSAEEVAEKKDEHPLIAK